MPSSRRDAMLVGFERCAGGAGAVIEPVAACSSAIATSRRSLAVS